MKKVLIYFTCFGTSLGGSEYLPLLFISELQKSCDVTLALNWKSDLAHISQLAGIDIDLNALKIVYIKPQSRLFQKLDAIIPFYRTWCLKKLALKADICISAANMIDFGKQGHHFIYLMRHFGDNSFYDFFMHNNHLSLALRFSRKLRTFLAERFLRPLLGVRSTRKILANPHEYIYPNSYYVEKTMKDYYGQFTSKVFYPPTTFDFKPNGNVFREPMLVVCIGRIIPEKRVTDIIDIVKLARTISGLDLRLHIAGQLTPQTKYSAMIEEIAFQNNWIKLVGAVYGKTKEDFLQSGTYAIHTRRDEEFGIAVAEYLKAGLIPIVPDEGGSCEVVDSPGLSYHTNEDAARILLELISDDSLRKKMNQHCAERALFFVKKEYLKRQHQLLNEILQG